MIRESWGANASPRHSSRALSILTTEVGEKATQYRNVLAAWAPLGSIRKVVAYLGAQVVVVVKASGKDYAGQQPRSSSKHCIFN